MFIYWENDQSWIDGDLTENVRKEEKVMKSKSENESSLKTIYYISNILYI